MPFTDHSSDIWNNTLSRGTAMPYISPGRETHAYTGTPENGDRPNGSFNRNTPSSAGWHTGPRSPSSSPNRTRAGGENNQMDAINSAFRQPRTNDVSALAYGLARGNAEHFVNSMNNLNLTQATPSRSSPPFGHTPSNSTQSQRMSNYSMLYHSQNQIANHQATNQNAFTYNNNNSIGLDERTRPTSQYFPPGTNEFQFNPTSQAWNDHSARNHASSNSIDLANAGRASHAYSSSSNRFTPSRPEQGVNYASFTPGSSAWASADSSFRPHGSDRRALNLPQALPQQFLPSPYDIQQQMAQYTSQLAGFGNAELYNTRGPATLPHPSQPGGYGHTAPNVRTQNSNKSPWLTTFCESLKNHERKQSLGISAIFGHVVEASGEQEASRFIQHKLSTARSDEKDVVFEEIGPNMVPLMMDVYGNYVIQKLIEHGSQAQKARVVEAAKTHVLTLSRNPFGCRVVQKIVEGCLVDQVAELLKEIRNPAQLKELMQDTQGNHVIQKTVATMPPDTFKFITEFCQNNARELSMDMHSCRVVQRVLERAEETDKRILLKQLHQFMDKLITDPWGNYVAGHIIEHRGPEDRDPIFELIMKKLSEFCRNKLASHVVEKCIEFGSPAQRTRIIQQLCSGDTQDTLYLTLKDPFGNYVIASMLKHLEWGTEERKQFKADVVREYHRTKTSGSNTKCLKSIDDVFKDDTEREEREESERAVTTRNSLQVEVDSAGPTPMLTNETNSPQSDSLPSANTSAIEVPSANTKGTEETLRVRDDED
ncbi:mRNA binding protein puf3 [Fusarium irregulare]|uniref:mRNA binding protein puf3 n=1 Tax=Fusarium irregulare TaxID=2494466 RepID=A0A9W8U889_9HYPO|nr:mRNA binding protein puf3 [Fusarium irregulare]KAJ4020049.1 mRNA binding protein puf3 [Fusarium irregulare]